MHVNIAPKTLDDEYYYPTFSEGRFRRTAIEYGLIASLIAVAIIAGATALGTSLNSTFQGVSSVVTGPAS